MRKIKPTKAEQWIESHLEEFVPASKDGYNKIMRAIEHRKKNAVLTILPLLLLGLLARYLTR